MLPFKRHVHSNLINNVTSAACHSRLRHLQGEPAAGKLTLAPISMQLTQTTMQKYPLTPLSCKNASDHHKLAALYATGVIINSFNYTIFTALYSGRSHGGSQPYYFISAIAVFSALACLSWPLKVDPLPVGSQMRADFKADWFAPPCRI